MDPMTLSAVDEKQSGWPPASKRANRSAYRRVRLLLGSLLSARRARGSISGKCIGSHTIKKADPFFNALPEEKGVKGVYVRSRINSMRFEMLTMRHLQSF